MSPAPRRQEQVRRKGAANARRTAESAAKKAKAAGATGNSRGKGATRKLMRDSAIVARAHSGVPTKAIAAEFEVTQRTVQRVLDEFNQAPSLLDARPMEVVEQVLRKWQRMIGDFEAMSYIYIDTNPNAALGAKKAAADAISSLMRSLVEIGKMPESLEVFRTTAEVSHLVDQLMERLDRFEAGELTASDVADYMRDVVTGVTPLYDADVIEGRETAEPDENGDQDGIGH